jgi:hypothetical protein
MKDFGLVLPLVEGMFVMVNGSLVDIGETIG